MLHLRLYYILNNTNILIFHFKLTTKLGWSFNIGIIKDQSNMAAPVGGGGAWPKMVGLVDDQSLILATTIAIVIVNSTPLMWSTVCYETNGTLDWLLASRLWCSLPSVCNSSILLDSSVLGGYSVTLETSCLYPALKTKHKYYFIKSSLFHAKGFQKAD